MTIGVLARAAEVGVETIRYYERLGSSPARSRAAVTDAIRRATS